MTWPGGGPAWRSGGQDRRPSAGGRL